MKPRIIDLKRLLNEIAQESGKTLLHANFSEMHLFLEKQYKTTYKESLPFGNEYLYRNIYIPTKEEKDDEKVLSLSPKNLDAIVKALGYKGYGDFLQMKHPTLASSLSNCSGAWYSYVRCNSGQPYVLRAPVRIFQEHKEMRVELKGPNRLFKGVFQAADQCLYCLLESGETKNIYLILKTGLVERIEVMQGVFSALSSGGDPIAGREILVRQGVSFEALTADRIPIDKMLQSDKVEENAVAHYFKDKESNIIKAGRSSTFELSDLQISA
ncbi:MAG: hypothetical protein ACRCYO_15220 [Bacteroidia bacterium]